MRIIAVSVLLIAVLASASFSASVYPKMNYWSGGVSGTMGYGLQIFSQVDREHDAVGDIGLAAGTGYTLISASLGGVRYFPPVTNLKLIPFAGAGVNYNILNISTLHPAGGSVAGAGLQASCGLLYGNALVQFKYLASSLTYNYSIAGVDHAVPYNGGGVLEAGYRFDI